MTDAVAPGKLDVAARSETSASGETAEQVNRLKGGLIDRSQRLGFHFNGRPLSGFGGDTLASALIANGQRLIGRSFKYHRPRGIFSAGSEEPNALVELRKRAHQEPNSRATVTELFDGLEANSQNHRGGLAFDLMSINDVLAPFSQRRLLLQDVHVAEIVLGEGVRADYPRRGRPRPAIR